MQAALELCLRNQTLPRSVMLQLMRARLLSSGSGVHAGLGAATDGSATDQHADTSAGARHADPMQDQSLAASASGPTLGLLSQQRQQERLQRQQHDARLQSQGAASSELASASENRQSSYMVRLARLGCAISRRDVRRFFRDFDIDDNSIRPQYNWGSHVVRAYWVFFKTEEERRRALAMTGQYLGPNPAMILKESDAYDLSQALQRAPGASHSRGRTVLVENLSYSTSLSGLLRQFEGFHLQEHAATLLEAAASEAHKGERVSGSELRDRRRAVADTQLPSKKMAHRLPEGGRSESDRKARAVVRFKTTEEAHRAVRQMNHTYVTNDCINMRVLY